MGLIFMPLSQTGFANLCCVSFESEQANLDLRTCKCLFPPLFAQHCGICNTPNTFYSAPDHWFSAVHTSNILRTSVRNIEALPDRAQFFGRYRTTSF